MVPMNNIRCMTFEKLYFIETSNPCDNICLLYYNQVAKETKHVQILV